MYSASAAARSAVADQQIGDDAVTRRRRLVGRRRAGTAAYGSMVDIQNPTAEIRRGNKKRKKKEQTT